MKTKFLKALIIDQDPGQGRAMALLVKEFFNQIHFEHDLASITKECQELKPRIMFFNLNVSQRTLNLDILEKLSLDEQTVIFGYIDAHEPELIAHAIELGFHDIFVKPFDPDIIATKINKFFRYEKTQDRGISYKNIRPGIEGSVRLPLKIINVDENGISFQTENYISKGTHFKLDTPLIQDIFGESPVNLMVTKSWLGDNWNEHFFFAEPTRPSEVFSSALRRFILRKL